MRRRRTTNSTNHGRALTPVLAADLGPNAPLFGLELARSLRLWVTQDGEQDFEFDSMSFDEPGAMTIAREGMGWVFTSMLTSNPSH